MSIMARARAKNPDMGYAVDFVSAVIKPHIAEIARQGVKLISNAGGTNPQACAAAVRAVVAEAGLDLTVAVVTGDDLTQRAAEFAGRTEMFSDQPFPEPDSIASINAYLGAFPIAEALNEGADIVITGRCVDSAVTLGALYPRIWLVARRSRPTGRSKSRRPYPRMRATGHRRKFHRLGKHR